MSNRNPRDRDNSNFKLPKLFKHQSERTVTPHLQSLAGRVPKQEETTGQHSTRDPLFAYRSDTTRYDDFARGTLEQSRDRGLRPLSRVGRQIQRTCQEDLRRRDKEMLNSILGRDTRAFNSQLCPSNSKSETNLFKVHPRSDQILQELYKDGFVATRRVGGLAFDVSLHGRPVRLSPIGAPDRRLSRNGCSKKRKKNTHQKQSAKRKKKEQKRKRRRRRKTIDSSDTDDSETGVIPGKDDKVKEDEDKEEDWEDVEEEEEEEE